MGALLHRGIKEKYKNVLYNGLGLVSLAIGLNATVQNLPKSQYPVLFIVAIALGGIVGTWLDIDGWFRRPLSMLGPVISALQGDNTLLFTNATLDFVSSTIFASTYGLGMVLAAPVLFCWQGMFYLVAKISSEAVSDALMSELLIVGGLLITASGLSLLKLKDCKTLNLLPALLVPVLWFLAKALF